MQNSTDLKIIKTYKLSSGKIIAIRVNANFTKIVATREK